jgi:hypothetical protein
MTALNSDCTQVNELTWKGERFEVGQRLAFDVTVWDLRGGPHRSKRIEGDVLELWIEPWRDIQLAYAEVQLDDGGTARAWFHRDHCGAAGTLGVVPAGALF